MAFDSSLGSTITAAVMQLDAQVTSSVLNGSDLEASDGENVKTWQDQDGSFDVTQSSSGARPVLDSDGINGNPAIQGASGDYLLASNVALVKNVAGATVAMVVKHTDTASIQRFFQATNSSDANRLMVRTDPTNEYLYVEGAAPDGSARSLFSNDAVSNDTVHIIIATWDFQGGSVELYLDGTQVHTASVTGGNNTSNTNVWFGVLSNRYGSLPYNGLMGHFLLYEYHFSSTNASDLYDELDPYWATPSAGGGGIKSSLSLLGVGS